MRTLRQSMRAKLLLTFLAIAIVPLSVATIVAVVKTRSTLEQRIGQDRATLADQVATSLDRIILERALSVQMLGMNAELAMATMGMADAAATRTTLVDAVQRSGGLLRVVQIYDAAGTLIATSDGVQTGTSSADVVSTEWFREGIAKDSPTFIGPVTRSADGRLVVRISDAIRAGDGGNLGVVSADLDWDALSRLALGRAEEQFEQGGSDAVRVYLVDATGQVIGSTNGEQVLRASVAGSTALDGITGGRNGSVVEPLFDGELSLVAYSRTDNGGDQSGWYRGFMDGQAEILVVESAATAFADASRMMTFLILFALAAAAIVGFVAWVIAGRIAGPLSRVVYMIQEMGKGHLGHRLEIEQEDEIGVLARTMNGFADALQHHVIGTLYRFAEGDLTYDRAAADEKDEIQPPLRKISETLGGLVDETRRLTEAARGGRLTERGEAGRFSGAYRELIEGINDTLNAVIEPIQEASAALERVAARDLTARMEGDYQGDFQTIKTALNRAVENLEEALGDVASGAEQVANASGQINQGSQVLAEGASEQASSLEEVTSSLQELASMTRQNAANAKEAKGLSEGARASAAKGVDSMRRLSAAVGKIQDSASATARIVKTIDEIAFQTNLLALNAAVEAARAGEAGKGFAVVAEEVRSLAMRSADAAKNTASLIEESVQNAEGGVSLNDEALRNLEEIAGQIERVSAVMAEIAAASDQQSQGVDQINTAVEQMNGVTQQTAANSEEAASAAEELSSQAERMRELVGEFRIRRVGGRTDTQDVRTHAPDRSAPATKSRRQRHSAARATVGARAHGESGNGHKRPNGRGGAAVDPTRLIPFDDDDDQVLGEF